MTEKVMRKGELYMAVICILYGCEKRSREGSYFCSEEHDKEYFEWEKWKNSGNDCICRGSCICERGV